MDLILEPWHWFILGVVLVVAELFLMSFAAMWFGVAAMLLSVLLWLFPGMAVGVQITLWVVLSVAITLLWFKYIKPLSIDKTKAGLSREATLGQIGMVIATGLDHEHITVRFSIPVLGSDEWACRSTQPVSVGDRVRVIDILGNDLLVQPHLSQSFNEN